VIISLRGTNGAGKSTLVRAVVARYAQHEDLTTPGRRRPVGRLWRRQGPGVGLFVLGHYEIANGGVDTLRSLDEAYEMIERYAAQGCDVLYEGKNMSDGPARLLQLHARGRDCHAVLLDLPLQRCVASVRARGHSIKESTIARLHAKSRRDCEALGRAGVHVLIHDNRDGALESVLQLLRLL
jgi:predicted kinase